MIHTARLEHGIELRHDSSYVSIEQRGKMWAARWDEDGPVPHELHRTARAKTAERALRSCLAEYSRFGPWGGFEDNCAERDRIICALLDELGWTMRAGVDV